MSACSSRPCVILLHMWDADGNGDIESTDATIVLQHEAGLLAAAVHAAVARGALGIAPAKYV